MSQLENLIDHTVIFSYDGVVRVVEIKSVHDCANGQKIIKGIDAVKRLANVDVPESSFTRSYRINKIQDLVDLGGRGFAQ